MARYSSKDVILLIDGYNVLGQTTELTHGVEALTEETTGFSDTWENHEYIGVQNYDLTQSGFYNDAALSVNAAFNEKQGDDRSQQKQRSQPVLAPATPRTGCSHDGLGLWHGEIS